MIDSSAGHDVNGLELPQPDADAIAASLRLVEAIVGRIGARGGVIGFDEYMQMALYQPGLGYYSNSSIKFGAFGDFVTAPEISPLFGACLARQAEALIGQGCGARILEFGAGSGRLCQQIMDALPGLVSYQILDLGAELKQRQQLYLRERLDADRYSRIEWLSRLPEDFDGIVIANEMLDALPVHRLHKRAGWQELGVAFRQQRLQWEPMAPRPGVLDAIGQIEARHGALPAGYRCELNLRLEPWFAALADACRRAVVMIVDYGYEQAEYYHPDRCRGTLECYYQHRRHSDPLIFPGLQDITAFVDFDACADAAEQAGFDVIGLVSQRQFLLANGLLEEVERRLQGLDLQHRLALSQQVQTLTMPDQMGQTFRVLALSRGLRPEMPALERGGARG